jgi:pimeloyl-ACP methyl ester carboxylesterase
MSSTVELGTRRVVHEGIGLHVAEVGGGDPALLFLHPAAADHTFFGPQVDEFSRRHRVVVMDQRGFGRSDVPEGPYGPAAMADDAACVIEELGLDRPVVVGSSMGGVVALELAVRRPDLVRGLVILNRSVVGNPRLADRIGDLVGKLRRGGDEAVEAVESLVRSQVGDLDAPELAERYLALARSVPPWVLAATFEGFVGWDGERALRQVAIPTLFTFSHMTGTYAEVDRLVELSPHVRIGHTVGAGHFDHLTVPDQLNPMIRRFLEVCVLPASAAPDRQLLM